MKAFVRIQENENVIEIVDDYGFTIARYTVGAIHTEVDKKHIKQEGTWKR